MAKTPFVMNPAIQAFAIAYRQENLIQDQIFPFKGVAARLFSYNKHQVNEAFRAPDTRVGRLGVATQMLWSKELVNDQIEAHALTTPVPVSDIDDWKNARAQGLLDDGDDPLMTNSALLMQSLLNARELRCANLALNLNNYTPANRDTLSGVAQWSDYANSRPITYLKRKFDKMIARPTHGALSQEVFTALSMHPESTGAVYKNGTNAGSVTKEQLAEQLGLKEIFIGAAWLDTAAPGLPSAISRVWGLDAVFFHRNDAATLTGGVTYGLTAKYGTNFGGTNFDPDVGEEGAEIVKVGFRVKELIMAPDTGFLVKNAVAAS